MFPAASSAWFSDNGPIFAAHRTIEVALALNVAPCSPRSKAVKQWHDRGFREDLQARLHPVAPIPNPATLALTDSWMEDYNSLPAGLSFTREYILSQPVACPV